MYTVKRFKANEIFESQDGHIWNDCSHSQCYVILDDNGKCVVTKALLTKKTVWHFYSRKKDAIRMCEIFNEREQ